MNRFAALLANGTPSLLAYAAYAKDVGEAEAALAHTLLSGLRPKRIAPAATVLEWVVQATQTPAFLLDACRTATADSAELASLLLPPATGTAPTLTETLATLTDRESWLALALRLPPPARLILNRLAAGTFRVKLAPVLAAPQIPGTCLAILTLIDPSGPDATFALRHGNGLVPLTKLRLTLTETAQILIWARAHTTDRFGPVRQVAPDLVFEIRFQGQTPNPRRKCGVDLVDAEVVRWHPNLAPDQADALSHIFAAP